MPFTRANIESDGLPGFYRLIVNGRPSSSAIVWKPSYDVVPIWFSVDDRGRSSTIGCSLLPLPAHADTEFELIPSSFRLVEINPSTL